MLEYWSIVRTQSCRPISLREIPIQVPSVEATHKDDGLFVQPKTDPEVANPQPIISVAPAQFLETGDVSGTVCCLNSLDCCLDRTRSKTI